MWYCWWISPAKLSVVDDVRLYEEEEPEDWLAIEGAETGPFFPDSAGGRAMS